MATELVGVAEVATMLGISKQRVSQLSSAPGFPVPVAHLAATKVWRRYAIADYARGKGLEEKPRALTESEEGWKGVAIGLATAARNPDLCNMTAALRRFDKQDRLDRGGLI